MLVLYGEFNGKSKLLPDLKEYGFGRMWASYGPAWAYENEPWGFDNGAWSAFANKTEFPEEKFKKRMAKARRLQRWAPTLAAVPDIVGSGLASIAFSQKWLESGDLVSDWPWYLVVQDGVCPERIRRIITKYSLAGIFLGGTDGFKRTAPVWCEMAHANGIRFHYGRCNREPWLIQAIEIGADSMDSTRPIRAATGGEMDRYKRFLQLVTGNCPQKTFDFQES